MQDVELVSRCLAGEPMAWDEFLRDFTPYLAAVIRGVLQRRGVEADDAIHQDLLQETFAYLMQNDRAALRAFRPRVPLKHYLAMIAAQRTLRRLHQQGREVSSWSPQARERLWKEIATQAGSGVLSPLESRELPRQVRSALDRLPKRDRLLLQLHYWDELPADRIGRYLGVKSRSVWALLSRARGRLAEILRHSHHLM